MPVKWFKKLRLLAALLVVLAVTIVAWPSFRRPPEALAMQPERKDVTELVIASGRLRAVRQPEIGADVSGVVEEVLVREGDSVQAKTPLVRLRTREWAEQLEQAQASVEVAREEVNRAAATRKEAETNAVRIWELFSQKVASQGDLDAAYTARDVARAAEQGFLARLRESEIFVKVAADQITKRTLLAPFPAVVIKRWVEPGDSVTAGKGLLTLAELDHQEIYVETDENNLAKLKVGQSAMIIAPAFPQRPFQGELIQIGPAVDPERGVVGLRLKPGPLPDYVLPNMTVDVNIQVGHFPKTMAVPTSSLLEEQGSRYVLAIRKGQTERVRVTLLGQNHHWAAVEGLSENEWVLIKATKVREKTRVRPVEAKPGDLP